MNAEDRLAFWQLKRSLSDRLYQIDPIERADPKIAAMVTAVRDEAARLLPDTVPVVVADRLRKADTENDKAYGVQATDPLAANRAAGTIIAVTLGVSNNRQGHDEIGTTRHEAIHALHKLGVISPEEWGLLEAMAPEWRKRFNVEARWTESYKDFTPEQRERAWNEEAICEAFAHRLHSPPAATQAESAGSVPRRLFERAGRFLDDVARRVRGIAGLEPDAKPQEPSWRDIFAQIDNGTVKARGFDQIARARDYDEQREQMEGALTMLAGSGWRLADIRQSAPYALVPALVHDDHPMAIVATSRFDGVAGRFRVYDPGATQAISPPTAWPDIAAAAAVKATELYGGRSLLDIRSAEGREAETAAYYRNVEPLEQMIQAEQGRSLRREDGQGRLHAVGKPAYERGDGTQIWAENGLCGRGNGLPACTLGDGTMLWMRDGMLDRPGGWPAVVTGNGRVEYWEGGLRHRDKGPAVEDPSGLREHYQYGLLHNADAPARVIPFRLEEWHDHGNLHRADGPARTTSGDFGWITMEYWRHGAKHNDAGPAVVGRDGSEEYWREGRRHRDSGPAVIHADGRMEWWRNGRPRIPSREEVQAYMADRPHSAALSRHRMTQLGDQHVEMLDGRTRIEAPDGQAYEFRHNRGVQGQLQIAVYALAANGVATHVSSGYDLQAAVHAVAARSVNDDLFSVLSPKPGEPAQSLEQKTASIEAELRARVIAADARDAAAFRGAPPAPVIEDSHTGRMVFVCEPGKGLFREMSSGLGLDPVARAAALSDFIQHRLASVTPDGLQLRAALASAAGREIRAPTEAERVVLRDAAARIREQPRIATSDLLAEATARSPARARGTER